MVFSTTILKEHSTNKGNKDKAKEEGKHLPVVPSTGITLPSPGKARRRFLKERELAEFTRRYYGNYSPDQICAELHMSRSTYYRCLRELGSQQATLLGEYGVDELLARIGKTQNTFNFISAEMVKRIINKEGKYSEEAELAAANLLCEIQAAELRLYTKGPIKTEQQLPLNIRRRLVTEEDGTQMQEIEIEIDSNNNSDEENSSDVEEDGNSTSR